jgi:hypothetical protein
MFLRYAWSIYRSGRRCIYGRRVALDYGSVFSKRPDPKPPAISAHHLPTCHVHSNILDLIRQTSPFANQLARIGHLHTNHSIGTPCDDHYAPISSLRRCYRSYNRSIITRRSADCLGRQSVHHSDETLELAHSSNQHASPTICYRTALQVFALPDRGGQFVFNPHGLHRTRTSRTPVLFARETVQNSGTNAMGLRGRTFLSLV